MRYTIYNKRSLHGLYAVATMVVLSLSSLSAWGQQKPAQIEFDQYKYEFGDVAEDGGSVTHVFTFTNTSSKPVVILDVVTSCGCTTPTYSRQPVKQGTKGEITVSFDPMNRPGRFSKSISVVTSASKEAAKLLIEGNVIPRVKTLEERYPFDMGEGLRFDSNFRAFAYVGRGDKVEDKIGYVNTSSREVTLALEQTESSGMLRMESPQRIAAGAEGEIKLVYEIPAQSDKYGSLNDVYSVSINGRKSRTPVSVHAIAVDKFDKETEDISAPSAELSKKFIKFGEIKHGQTVEDTSVELSNDGSSDLIIRAVEWRNKTLECSLHAGDHIRAGEKAVVKLKLTTSSADYGVWVDRLEIITNDPARPMQTLRVTAIIVD